MKNDITLTVFVEDILTNYEIEYTEKNFNKVRMKFERELKRLHVWDKCEQKLIGKKKTRVFPLSMLKRVENNCHNYLLKIGNIDMEHYFKYLKEYEEQMEKRYEEEPIVLDKRGNIIEDPYPYVCVSKRDKVYLMIEALYSKFFEPIDVEKWESDLNRLAYIDDIDMDEIPNYQASKRLENKVKYYVKEKKED